MKNLAVRMPSGTRRSPSSEEAENVDMTRCLSLRLSEARMGAEVFSWPIGFLNIVVVEEEYDVPTLIDLIGA